MIKHSLSAAFIALTLTTTTAWANKPETPTAAPGIKVINVDEGKTLASSKGAVFVDTRNAMNFGKGRVPGALSAAYKEKSEPVADFDSKRQGTTRLVNYVRTHCFRETFAAVARQVSLDEKTIRHIFDDFVEELETRIRFRTPRVLGPLQPSATLRSWPQHRMARSDQASA